jgi:flagellar biogenesis protein FliO
MPGQQTMDWIRQTLSVLLVVGPLATALAWLRRRGVTRPSAGGSRASSSRRLELIERVALTPQHSVHLLRMDDRLVLVGRSPAGLTRLAVAAWRDRETSA